LSDLLKEKTHVSTVIKEFINKINTQFSTTLHVLRTDNALAYIQKKFLIFMHLMIYIKLFVHTLHNRMRLLEENLRHLLNEARTLLIHMHVPKIFWAKAILCACHLINKIPSSMMHDKILFSCLYHEKPIFFVPRVFGSACFDLVHRKYYS